MILYDLFADGQTDARSRVFRFYMQSLEDIEDLFGVFRFEANSIIADADVIITGVGY